MERVSYSKTLLAQDAGEVYAYRASSRDVKNCKNYATKAANIYLGKKMMNYNFLML